MGLHTGEETPQPSLDQVLDLLQQQQQDGDCLDMVRQRKLTMHDVATDSNGVHHVALMSEVGPLQYLAVREGQVLHADPSVCAPSLLQKPKGGLKEDKEKEAGEDEMLSLKDPIVKQCVGLFHATAKDICGEDLEFKPKSATVDVIDGLEVKVSAMLRK